MRERGKAVKDKTMTRSQQRRREDIVQAALRVFDRDGFEGARIDDVAAGTRRRCSKA